MDDFQTSTDRFVDWFKSVGGTFRDDLLEIKDLRSREAGRGIIARMDIPEDTTLFTIPRSAIINVETSDLCRLIPNIFDTACEHAEDGEGDEPLDPWSSLILVMLYEFLQGDSSKWKPYVDVLPTTFDTPIFWTQDELKELDGTSLTTEKIGKQESDVIFRSRILPLVRQHAEVFYPEGAIHLNEDELLMLAHRIGSIIMSYAFDLDDNNDDSDYEEDGWIEDRYGQTMLGMVPMADILNANADFNAHVNHGIDLEVTSLRSITKAGTEILNYYGPLSSSELLRRYGYTTNEHHRYDTAELSWSLVRSTIPDCLDVTLDILQNIENGLDEDDLEEYFVFERDAGDPFDDGRLSNSVDTCKIPAELNQQLRLVMRALKKAKPNLVSDKRKRDEAQFLITTKALATRLCQFPTTAEDDDALLKKENLSRRHRMAIEVRLGEKLLLGEAIAPLIEYDVDAQDESSSKSSSKRTRT